MLDLLQRIGRALLLPIAVLPLAAVLLRIGAPDLLDVPFISAAGAAVFDNLALLFAIGIATGMADDHRGEAALTAVIGYYVITGVAAALITSGPPLGAGYAADDQLVLQLNNNVFVGFVAGLLAVWTYNRFSTVQLPSLLAYFSGRRLPPVLISVFVLIAAFILGLLWPPLWNGIYALNGLLLAWGTPGTAVYGVLNRALIPFGLNHVLNRTFWFDAGQYTLSSGEIVSGDIPRFLSGDPAAGAYLTGFYPIVMFGLVGAAVAMIIMAYKSERAKIIGLLGIVALVSLLTGISQPLEYAFLFAAPLLFAVHALLTGASLLVTNLMGLRHGFGFGPGLVDYLLYFDLAERPVDLAIVGGIFFVIYLIGFILLIYFLDLKTPGRAGELAADERKGALPAASDAAGAPPNRAAAFVTALGGADNLVRIDSCAARLRITVQDGSKVSTSALQHLGAKGVIKPSKTAVQVIVGAEAAALANEMRARSAVPGSALPASSVPDELPERPAANGEPALIQTAQELPVREPAAAEKEHGEPAAPVPASEVAAGAALVPAQDVEPAAAAAAAAGMARPKTQPRPGTAAPDPAITAAVNFILNALGGPQNIAEADIVATTRLRVVVHDPSEVDEEAIRAAGAGGVLAIGDTYHILLGMRAQLFGEEFDARLAEEAVS